MTCINGANNCPNRLNAELVYADKINFCPTCKTGNPRPATNSWYSNLITNRGENNNLPAYVRTWSVGFDDAHFVLHSEFSKYLNNNNLKFHNCDAKPASTKHLLGCCAIFVVCDPIFGGLSHLNVGYINNVWDQRRGLCKLMEAATNLYQIAQSQINPGVSDRPELQFIIWFDKQDKNSVKFSSQLDSAIKNLMMDRYGRFRPSIKYSIKSEPRPDSCSAVKIFSDGRSIKYNKVSPDDVPSSVN